MDRPRITDLQPHEMVEGKKYSIIHQLHGVQRYPRVSVLVYLGRDRTRDEYQFNARPVAGTTAFDEESILSIVEVPADTPVSVNRRAE